MLIPTPVPTATCTTPYEDVAPIRVPRAQYPDSARVLGLGYVVVTINVTVGPDGKPTVAKIWQSSGNMTIDQEARNVALQATYAPKIVACKPVVGSYELRVPFKP